MVWALAWMPFTQSQRRKLWLAVVVSLLAHALLLSLAFSGPGMGTPGLGLNLRDRRVQAPEVRVVMVPPRGATTQPAAMPTPLAATAQRGAGELNPVPVAPAGPLPPAANDTAAPGTAPAPAAMPEPKAVAEAAVAPQVSLTADATARMGTLSPSTVVQATTIAVDKMALDPPRPAALVVPGELPLPMIAVAPAPVASSPERALPPPRAANAEVLTRITPLAREQAVNLAGLNTSAQEAQRQSAQLQTAFAETARVDAEREQLTRQLATRQEAAKQEALRQESARQEAARQEAARALAAQADADTARREASRRAMGRQLDEEAARRRETESAAAAIAVPSAASPAVRQATPLPLSWSSARRGRLLGRADPNAELVLYAEAWARKIQLNMTIDQVREVAQQRHASPLVTVAIRQDGSVEAVTFVVSSGVPQIDEAIRRIVQSQAPYPAFAPALARDFDVIEIRRNWTFDTAVRLY